MKISVGVLTEDEFVFQKIYLTLSEVASVYRAASAGDAPDYDIFLYTVGEVSHPNAYRIGRDADATIGYPISITALRELVRSAEGQGGALLKMGDRAVFLRGKKIALTDVEYALLELLYRRGGDFVTREELMEKIWKGEADGGVLNVYIHYLRTKLEDGEKIIISSRKNGYKIDGKYL